jgi:hypothetical protein
VSSSWPVNDKKKAEEINCAVECILDIFERTITTLAEDRGIPPKHFAMLLILKWKDRLGVKMDD